MQRPDDERMCDVKTNCSFGRARATVGVTAPLPVGVQVQIDLVDEHEAARLAELGPRGHARAHVEEEVPRATRRRPDTHRRAPRTAIAPLQLANRDVVLGAVAEHDARVGREQLRQQVHDLLVPPRVLGAEGPKPR